MIELVLTLCTVLGGIAAVMYFKENWRFDWLTRLRSFGKAPAVPIDRSSLFAYANSHHRPLKIAQAVAKSRGLEFRSIDSESAWLNEQVQLLEIKTVRELDHLVKRHGAVASRLSDYMTQQEHVDTGFVLARIFEVVAIKRGGKEGLIRFCSSLKYSTGGANWAEKVFRAYEQVTKFG